jgi:hypothetical protein
MFYTHQNTDVARARKAIWALLPDAYQDHLRKMHWCESREHSEKEWRKFLDLIGEDHEKSASRRHVYFDFRSPCPLCRDVGNSPYEHQSGFKAGEGIHRHLTGSHNTIGCPVIDAIYWWYLESADFKFLEQETQENLLALEELEVRRRTETLYTVHPDDPPKLIDEGYGETRSKEELEWAEERLTSLGFSILVDGNVKTYLWESDELKIYADPRIKKNITMIIFPQRGRKKHRAGYGRFVFQDRFRNKLVEQFEKLIEENRDDF